jgi:hypothetical protein
MKRALAILSILAVLVPPVLTGAAQPQDFRFMAGITGDLTPGVPVRLPLPREVIAAASNGFADLRLFDDHGQETPYVIYMQSPPQSTPVTFNFRVLSYSRSAEGEHIVLERPEDSGAFYALTLVTRAHNFHQSVRIQTSQDLATWEELGSDTIFDFSARIAWRKTTIEVPETEARYVRLILQEAVPPTAHGPDMTLYYEGLQFRTGSGKATEVRIDQIVAQREPVAPVYDRVSLPHPDTTTDKDGNTVVRLGSVRLPIAELTLQVDNVYYHRQVELWAADMDKEEAYHQLTHGVIYKIPGMPTAKNTLLIHQPQQSYMQVKILNGDNPPLRVQQVDLAWVRQNLYFIPEAGRRYTLYCGGEQVHSPTYELRHLLPAEHAKLQHYTAVSTDELRQNPNYRPHPAQDARSAFEKTLFMVVLLLLAGGMGFWLYRLMQHLPAR